MSTIASIIRGKDLREQLLLLGNLMPTEDNSDSYVQDWQEAADTLMTPGQLDEWDTRCLDVEFGKCDQLEVCRIGLEVLKNCGRLT